MFLLTFVSKFPILPPSELLTFLLSHSVWKSCSSYWASSTSHLILTL